MLSITTQNKSHATIHPVKAIYEQKINDLRMQLTSHFYTINNVTLHVKEAGDSSMPAILFLHGFPCFWYSWQQQTEYFVSQGYRVIVPDQRGYNESSKPNAVKDYRLSVLADDMVQLLTLMKVKQTFLVAHDWGGVVAWALIKTYPQRFTKAVIINAPYPPAYAKFSFIQLIKSWYVFFFQLPRLPEWMMKRNRFAMLVTMMVNSSLPGTFTTEDIALYKQAWQKEGSLTAMIDWYRAMAKYRADVKVMFGMHVPVEVPVRVLWGLKDKFLNKTSGVCPAKHCTRFSMKEYNDATHWLPMEKSDAVNEEIWRFFTTK